MSASKDKKFRKEQAAAGLDKKAIAAAEEEKKRKAEHIKGIVVGAAVVIIIVLAFIVSSAFLSKHLKAVEINGEKYTVAQTNFYYSYCYTNFYQNYYYYFMYGMGPFDTSTALDEQECSADYADEENWHEGYTWHDYFVDNAIETMTQVQMLCDQAEAAGYTLDEEQQAEYQSSLDSINSAWESNGYSSLQQFLNVQYGEGVTEEVLETELARIYLASAYDEYVYDSFEYSTDELDSYYTEHADELDSINFAYYQADDEATAETIAAAIGTDVAAADDTASDEASAEADTEASTEASEEVAAAADGTAVVDALNEYLAANYTDEEDGTAPTATELSYSPENITTYYSEDMATWLNDAGRAAGDVTVIANEDGTAYVVVYIDRDTHDYDMVSFRHILVNAVDEDEDGTYTDEEIAAAHDTAESYYEEWLNGDATEDSFAELANTYSEDTGSNTEGGLYEDVYQGEMVEGINDWLFEAGRTAGDTAVIDNNGSYTGTHVVYFVGTSDMTYAESLAESEMRSADLEEYIDTNVASYTAVTSHLGMVGDAH